MTTSGLGHVLLLTLVVSSAGSLVVSMNRPRLGRRLLLCAGVAVWLATGLLVRALLHLDFSLVYVADAARRSASAPYRLAGLWAGMAGSLLLWTAVTSLVAGLAVGHIARALPLLASTTQMVVAGIVLGLAVTVRWAADPFGTLSIPATDGGGIVPILEHPAMLIHPPLLYIGMALTMPLFAVTIAAMLHRSLDDGWSSVARRLALLSWTILTVAMALGAAWADDELGWGGFWAWDPVENGVLLPWLALTAFLHARQRPRSRLASTLPVVTFLFASLGAVLSRSGAVASVHAFAEATLVGEFLLVSLVGALVLSLVAVLRVALHKQKTREIATRSDRLLTGNAIVVLGMSAVVLVGTVWPVVNGWFGGQKRAVQAGFFNRFGALAALSLLVLMALEAWGNRRRFVGRLAHLGLALFIVGAMASSFGHSMSVTVRAGDTVMLGGQKLVVGTPVVSAESTYRRIVVPVSAGRHRLTPHVRIYEEQARSLARPERSMGLLNDTQVAVRNVSADGFIRIEAHTRPLLWLVWFGVLIMSLGGALSVRRGLMTSGRRGLMTSGRPNGQSRRRNITRAEDADR